MPRIKPPRPYKLLIMNLLIAGTLGGPLLVPNVREWIFISGLSPRSPVRNLAASFLRWHSSDPSVTALTRVVNTVGPAFNRELAATAVASLSEIAGRSFDSGGDWNRTVARINDWAAERLGRPLDDNDGVLHWFPPSDKVRGDLDEIADKDPEVAWRAWSAFDVLVATNSGEFLWKAGMALGDPRPISFSIHRVDGYFEGQPHPIDSGDEGQLVDTVGESLALLLWQYAGVGDDEFPEDFASWWREYARLNHLPPPVD